MAIRSRLLVPKGVNYRMKDSYTKQIVELLENCDDITLLDLILRILTKSI